MNCNHDNHILDNVLAMAGDPNIIRPLSNFFYYIRNKKVLIIGAGGGGDVCGCLPLYSWLKSCHAHPILGSLTWERIEVHQDYGPRPFEEIEGLFNSVGSVAYGDQNTKIVKDGTLFQASHIARGLHESIVFIDITKGVATLVKDLTKFIQNNQIDMVIALDVGGDILARGKEPGLQSPLADAMTLAVMASMKIPKAIGIFGLNCDGELTIDELNQYLMEFNLKDWVYGQRFHTEEELRFMEKLLDSSGAVTEASRMPLRYLNGERGQTTLRGGTRKVILDEIITRTFFLRVDEVYDNCPLAKAVARSNSIIEANNILLSDFSLISEFEGEKRRLKA
jgi:hypothetical protein